MEEIEPVVEQKHQSEYQRQQIFLPESEYPKKYDPKANKKTDEFH